MSEDRFVRIELDIRRKLRFKHRDLRDAVKDSGKSIGELFGDPFGGWAYLLLYGLRWQDLKLTLDKCSGFIDGWVEDHEAEKVPLDSMGEKILEALNASGFVKIQAETPLDLDKASEGSEGNAKPEAVTLG